MLIKLIAKRNNKATINQEIIQKHQYKTKNTTNMNLKYILPLIILVHSALGKCLVLVITLYLLPRVTKLKVFYLAQC